MSVGGRALLENGTAYQPTSNSGDFRDRKGALNFVVVFLPPSPRLRLSSFSSSFLAEPGWASDVLGPEAFGLAGGGHCLPQGRSNSVLTQSRDSGAATLTVLEVERWKLHTH